jgi:hypothetical protein
MPIYLYSPMMFFSLAVGAILDGALRRPPAERPLPHRAFVKALALVLAIHALGAFVWTYGGFNRKFHYPEETLPKVLALLRDAPPEQPVMLVDAQPLALPLPHLIREATGRRPEDVVVLSMLDDPAGEQVGHLSPVGPRSFQLENVARPYFGNPAARALSFIPRGAIVKGRTVHREWFDVTITEVGSPPPEHARGHRFFSEEPGVAVIRVDLSPGLRLPPRVIAFRQLEPVLVEGLFASEGTATGSGGR